MDADYYIISVGIKGGLTTGQCATFSFGHVLLAVSQLLLNTVTGGRMRFVLMKGKHDAFVCNNYIDHQLDGHGHSFVSEDYWANYITEGDQTRGE